MIKNVVFDIGKVLVGTRPVGFFAESGFNDEEARLVAERTFMTPEWGELDRGVLPYEEIVETFAGRLPGYEDRVRAAFRSMKGIIWKYDYADGWLRAQRDKGLGIYCLSNMPDQITRDCWDEMDFLDWVDGYVLSYREKLIKPDPAIYRVFLDRFGLRPEECIFIDDLEANIQAARELGFRGIVFRGQEEAEAAIEELRR